MCFLLRNLQWQHAGNDCHRPLMVRPRRDGWEVGEGRSLHSLSRCRRTQAWRAEPALPPPREAAAMPTSLLRVRNVSTLRVCQRCASCAARGSRRELPESCRRPRRLARSRGLPRVWRKLATRAHMPHVRRSSCHDVWIDLEQALACIPAILLSTPPAGADQSNPSGRG